MHIQRLSFPLDDEMEIDKTQTVVGVVLQNTTSSARVIYDVREIDKGEVIVPYTKHGDLKFLPICNNAGTFVQFFLFHVSRRITICRILRILFCKM